MSQFIYFFLKSKLLPPCAFRRFMGEKSIDKSETEKSVSFKKCLDRKHCSLAVLTLQFQVLENRASLLQVVLQFVLKCLPYSNQKH